MTIKIENFILEDDNFLPKDYCDQIILYYENMSKAGFCQNRIELESRTRHTIDDTNIGLTNPAVINLTITQQLMEYFLKKLWNDAYKQYTSNYSILSSYQAHYIRAIKLQKSEIGQGFHIWHSENDNVEVLSRILTFIVYLNDVNEGGETELLYYHKRIKATTGKLILFPGSFTHTHRGNPPISNEKYILTGWIEF